MYLFAKILYAITQIYLKRGKYEGRKQKKTHNKHFIKAMLT